MDIKTAGLVLFFLFFGNGLLYCRIKNETIRNFLYIIPPLLLSFLLYTINQLQEPEIAMAAPLVIGFYFGLGAAGSILPAWIKRVFNKKEKLLINLKEFKANYPGNIIPLFKKTSRVVKNNWRNR